MEIACNCRHPECEAAELPQPEHERRATPDNEANLKSN
jgi:hypothetical protein